MIYKAPKSQKESGRNNTTHIAVEID